MSDYPLNKIILFEYDVPIEISEFLNYESGIWFWTITNTVATIEDDYGVLGYYDYQNSIKYNIKSFRVDNDFYARVTSFSDLRTVNKSFYYDIDTTKLYVHFDGFEPPLSQDIFYGGSIGYSLLSNNISKPYYNNTYYEPRLISASGVKKSIDPLFFGVLKYSTGSVTLINADGEFDDWRSRNLYGQPGRILVGDHDDAYTDFITVYEGYISDDSRTFDQFTMEIEDKRKALTQPVAANLLNTTDWHDLNDNDVSKSKPVAYGSIYNAKSICLNQDESGSPARTFLICDTEFNYVDSLDAIYVDGTLTAITGSANLTAGTFTMTNASVAGNLDKVTIDFTATDFDNGVEIIKDLMLNYDYKTFISTFWDTTEVTSAVTDSRSTSIYIDDGSKKLSDIIQEVAVDIDARFFVKNSGVYTVRIYDENRTPNTTPIRDDEWLNFPEIQNNGSEYLSSVIIEYYKNQSSNTYRIHENTDYQTESFNRYKKLKTTTFKTNLTTLSDATEKSETIMNISKEVQDLISRETTWGHFGIEPTDFITAAPAKRLSGSDASAIYEVMSVSNDLENFKIKLSLRYVKAV